MGESLPGQIFKIVFNVLFERKGGCKEWKFIGEFILIRISKCSRAECSIDSLDSTSSTLDCISFQS